MDLLVFLLFVGFVLGALGMAISTAAGKQGRLIAQEEPRRPGSGSDARDEHR
jgi:hypothetical protein